jgi:SAM-dependent methyltransferase
MAVARAAQGTLWPVANAAETLKWNDQQWVESWRHREKLTEAVMPYMVDAIGARPGQRVCDIGCGGGGLTTKLANLVGADGAAVGIDLSAPLLELASERADQASVANISFVQLDVQTGTLDEAPFDIAVSQFGVMFFDEPTAAFRAIRNYLQAGGRFVFACWQGVERNPWYLATSMRPLLPPPPVPAPGKSPVGPFSLGDDEYVRDILAAAGFGDVHGTPHETKVRAPASAVFDQTMLRFMGVPSERGDDALQIVARHLERFAVGEGEYEYPLAFTIYHATNA